MAGGEPDTTEQLKRQIDYFSSDQLLIDRAELFRGRPPDECWAATVELCAALDWFLARMDPETRARALEPEPLSEEIVAILEAMQRA